MYKSVIFKTINKLIFFFLLPLIVLEKAIYFFRDIFWNLPDVILKPNKIRNIFVDLYTITLPFSNFFIAFLISAGFIYIISTGLISRIVYSNKNAMLIEGVVMGVDTNGQVQKINKIDPFVQTNIQLEKDIIELIYEPIIKLEFIEKEDGSKGEQLRKVLAENVFEIRPGADYRFDLKQNIFWHDGKKFTAEDVIHTFDIISKLNSDNSYTLALKQLQWEKVDDYSVRVCTKDQEGKTKNDCSNTKDNPILSNFLELISVKIVPKHLTKNLNPFNYDLVRHPILTLPIGTGKFKFAYSDNFGIHLNINNNYHETSFLQNNQIKQINFRYYPNLEEAVSALLSSNIHSIASVNTEFINKIKFYEQINKYYSEPLYNQYWAIYFNLNKNTEGQIKSKEYLHDVKVRQAISSAINRTKLIELGLKNLGEEALGPINKYSQYFNEEANWYRFNLEKANKLLNEAGWEINPNTGYRINNKGEMLALNLFYLDSEDRKNIAKLIQDDLKEVGIKLNISKGLNNVEPAGFTLDELMNVVLKTKNFDLLLFGMSTFIDPDRYELFHSSKSEFPGRNIAGYRSTEESVIPNPNRQSINDRSLINIPKVDKLLDQARRFDPKQAIDKRKRDYNEVQQLIAEDAPVVFLYHPRFVYYVNKIVTEVSLKNVQYVEDRFRHIEKWRI